MYLSWPYNALFVVLHNYFKVFTLVSLYNAVGEAASYCKLWNLIAATMFKPFLNMDNC